MQATAGGILVAVIILLLATGALGRLEAFWAALTTPAPPKPIPPVSPAPAPSGPGRVF